MAAHYPRRFCHVHVRVRRPHEHFARPAVDESRPANGPGAGRCGERDIFSRIRIATDSIGISREPVESEKISGLHAHRLGTLLHGDWIHTLLDTASARAVSAGTSGSGRLARDAGSAFAMVPSRRASSGERVLDVVPSGGSRSFVADIGMDPQPMELARSSGV